jgi:hypothetical protein
MDRDRQAGGPPGWTRPGSNGTAGRAARPRRTCGVLGICLLAAVTGGPAQAGAAAPARAGVAAPAAQTITFGQPAGTSTGKPATAVGAAITLRATASSGQPVSFRSDTPLVCAISRTASSTTVTAAAGVCAITASQAGSAGFAAAPEVARAFQVGTGAAQRAVTFDPPVSGTTVTTLTPGNCSITASQGGSTTYAAALAAARSFRVNPAPPTLPGALIGALAAAALAAAVGVLALRHRRLRLRRRPPAPPGPSVRAEPSPGPPGSASVRATGATVAHTMRIRSDPGAGTITIKETRHDTSNAAGAPADRP